jgi:hypothetical protein
MAPQRHHIPTEIGASFVGASLVELIKVLYNRTTKNAVAVASTAASDGCATHQLEKGGRPRLISLLQKMEEGSEEERAAYQKLAARLKEALEVSAHAKDRLTVLLVLHAQCAGLAQREIENSTLKDGESLSKEALDRIHQKEKDALVWLANKSLEDIRLMMTLTEAGSAQPLASKVTTLMAEVHEWLQNVDTRTIDTTLAELNDQLEAFKRRNVKPLPSGDTFWDKLRRWFRGV